MRKKKTINISRSRALQIAQNHLKLPANAELTNSEIKEAFQQLGMRINIKAL